MIELMIRYLMQSTPPLILVHIGRFLKSPKITLFFRFFGVDRSFGSPKKLLVQVFIKNFTKKKFFSEWGPPVVHIFMKFSENLLKGFLVSLVKSGVFYVFFMPKWRLVCRQIFKFRVEIENKIFWPGVRTTGGPHTNFFRNISRKNLKNMVENVYFVI